MPVITTPSDLRIFRRLNGVPVPPTPNTVDTQAERLSRSVQTYVKNPTTPIGGTSMAVGGGSAPTPWPATLAKELAAFLQQDWPGAQAQSATEYYWYIDPITFRLIKVCIDNEIAVSQELTPSGALVPVNPPLVISIQEKM